MQGKYYNLTPNSTNNADPDFVDLAHLQSLLASQTPAVTANTTTGGVTTFDFSNAGYGTGTAFSSQGYNGTGNFIATWTGKVNIATAGVTNFYTTSDDGSMLFVDGNTVVNNNFFQGQATRSGSANLTAGAHDITIAFYQGGGGFGVQAGFGTATGSPFSNTLLSPQTIQPTITYGNNVNVTGASSTIDVQTSNIALMGALSLDPVITLNSTGNTARFTGTTFTGAGGSSTYNLNQASGSEIDLNQITDSGAALTINKSGAGSLLLDSTTTAGFTNASTVVNVAGGALILAGKTGDSNPTAIGSGTVSLGLNGILSLTSKAGAITFNTPITVTDTSSVVSGGVALFSGRTSVGQTVTLGSALSIPSTKVLSLGANDGTLVATGLISGNGILGVAGSSAGVVSLPTANSYLGGTNLSAGSTLQVGNKGSLGSGTLTFMNGTLSSTLALTTANSGNAITNAVAFGTGQGGTIGGSQDIELSGAVNLGTSVRSLVINDTSANGLNLSGQITGTGGISKSGAGNLILSNSTSTFSGGFTYATNVAGGAVGITGGSSGTPGALTSGPFGTGTVNIGNGGSGNNLNSTGASVTLGNAFTINGGLGITTAGTLTFSGLVTLATAQADLFTNTTGTTSLIFSNTISGNQNFNLRSAGATNKVVLAGANSYTGNTSETMGVLIADVSAPLSAVGAFGNSATAVTLGDANTLTNSIALLTGGTAGQGTAGPVIARAVTVNNLGTGAVTIGGSVDNNSSFTGAITLGRSANLQSVATVANATTFSGLISGAGTATKTGAGIAVINNANNTFAGFALSAGTVQFNGTDTVASGAVTKSTLGLGTIALNGGIFQYTGGAALNLAHAVSFGGNTAITNAGGSVTFDSTALTVPGQSSVSAASILTLNTPLIIKNSMNGTGSLTVSASSTSPNLTLSGANTYSGGTTFNGNGSAVQSGLAFSTPGGILTLNNASGSATGTGALTVNNAILTGTGTSTTASASSISNTVISPDINGVAGTIGTLAVNAPLTLTNDILNFDIGTSGAGDRFTGTNTLASSGTNTINILSNAGSAGTINLLSFGAVSGSTFVLGSRPSDGRTYNLVASAGQINLQILGALNYWHPGVGSQTWDIGTTANWSNSNNSIYTDLDQAVFDDAHNTNGIYTVNISTTGGVGVQPSDVQVNSSNNYTIGGDKIYGTTGLTKSGSGSLSLTGANTFTGPVVVGNGTLIANTINDTASSIGVGTSLTLGDAAGGTSGTLQYTGASTSTNRGIGVSGPGGTVDVGTANVTFGGNVTGSGTLTKAGSGTLTLPSTTNGNTGSVVINQGILSVGSLGAGSGASLTIGSTGNSATYQYTGTGTPTENRTVSLAGTGANITVTQAGTNLNLASQISGSTPLTLTGPGSVTLNGANIHTGGTTITGGSTVIGNFVGGNTPIGTSGALTLSGGTFQVNTGSSSTTGLIGKYFSGTTGNYANITPLLAQLNTTATATTTLTAGPTGTGLDFGGYGDFNTQFGTSGNGGSGQYYFYGTYTPQVSGTTRFEFTRQDDNSTFYIESTPGSGNYTKLFTGACCGVAGPGSATLTAGSAYGIIIADEDNGGGIAETFQFDEGNTGTFSIVKPSTQGTRWQFTGAGTANNVSHPVNVTADSTIALACNHGGDKYPNIKFRPALIHLRWCGNDITHASDQRYGYCRFCQHSGR